MGGGNGTNHIAYTNDITEPWTVTPVINDVTGQCASIEYNKEGTILVVSGFFGNTVSSSILYTNDITSQFDFVNDNIFSSMAGITKYINNKWISLGTYIEGITLQDESYFVYSSTDGINWTPGIGTFVASGSLQNGVAFQRIASNI